MGGAPSALAQQAATPALAQDELESEEDEVQERLRSGEMREELYAEFTAALADELGIGNADEVDAAIRVAMMTVVDARVDDGFFSVGQAEALKTLIATSDVPLGPGPMFGPPPGAFMRGGHGFGEEDRFFPIRHGDEEWIIPVGNGSSDQNAVRRTIPRRLGMRRPPSRSRPRRLRPSTFTFHWCGVGFGPAPHRRLRRLTLSATRRRSFGGFIW